MAYESEEERRSIDQEIAEMPQDYKDLLNLDDEGLRWHVKEMRRIQKRREEEGFLGRIGRDIHKGLRRQFAPLLDLRDYLTPTKYFTVPAERLRELQGMFGELPQPRGYSVMDMMSERHKGGVPFPEGELGQMELDLMMGKGLRAPGGGPNQRLIDSMYEKLPRKRGR